MRRSLALVAEFRDCSDRRQAAAREDVLLDEVLPGLRSLVLVVVDDDALQSHATGWANEPGARREERVVQPPVDSLDHLDGHQVRELPLQIAIVLVEHCDPVAQPGLCDCRRLRTRTDASRWWSW